jgi:hypothetical protein
MKLLVYILALISVSSSAFAGTKSHVPGSHDGTYTGSDGGNHRGGHYTTFTLGITTVIVREVLHIKDETPNSCRLSETDSLATVEVAS